MAGKAVKAVQRQMFLKLGQADEALEGGVLHPAHVGKAHVISHQRQDLLALAIAEAQSGEHIVGDAHADLDVAVEADAVRRAAEGGGLADIVQQRAPGEGE